MLEAGLTGGIASGKSTVAAMFVALGAILIDTDQLARRAVEPGSPGLAQIVEVFGAQVLDQAGQLDRRRLRQRVFSDPQARARLNGIVHPRIAALVDQELAQARAQAPRGVALVDVPLLFEAGWHKRFKLNILVYAPAEEQRRRLMSRDQVDEEDALLALAAQMPLEQKRALAQIIVDNSGSLAETHAQVQAAWGRLCQLAASDSNP